MDGIGTVRIVCFANRRTTPIAFAVGKRLERVARSDLGPALERQVGRNRSIRLDRLSVRLELDPRDYDDPTLASLWASRIREALSGAGADADVVDSSWAGKAAHEAETEHVDMAGADQPPEPSEVSDAARRAIAGDEVAVIELARAILFDRKRIGLLLQSQLSEEELEAVVRALEASNSDGSVRNPAEAGRRGPARRQREKSVGSRSSGRRRGRSSSWATRLAAASKRRLSASGLPTVRSETAAARKLRRSIASRPDRAAARDHLLHSDAGGLCFLWPWLTTYLEAAVQRLPAHDPRDSRRLALAGLLPDLPGAVDDAMVRLLAGDDLAHEPSVIVVTKDELRFAANGADAVLEAFAAAIPGFGGSTPSFVRREFLDRPGVIDTRTDPVSVRLVSRPLDPMISRLPYPIGMFRLPWTPAIALHIEVG